MAKKTPAAKPETTKPSAKRKAVVAKATPSTQPLTSSDKKLTLRQQIESLQKQMLDLDQEAVAELKSKLAEARKLVVQMEDELSTLTGKSTGESKAKRIRRPTITDEALKDQILKAMASFGKEGMNAKQLAGKLNQDALRIRKYIKDNPKILKRQGSGPGTKFFLQ